MSQASIITPVLSSAMVGPWWGHGESTSVQPSGPEHTALVGCDWISSCIIDILPMSKVLAPLLLECHLLTDPAWEQNEPFHRLLQTPSLWISSKYQKHHTISCGTIFSPSNEGSFSSIGARLVLFAELKSLPLSKTSNSPIWRIRECFLFIVI